MSDTESPRSGGTQQRLGCLGRFAIVAAGVFVLLALGVVGEAVWERYRPITDADLMSACTQIVSDNATDWHTGTRTYVNGICEDRLQDPTLREQIRNYLEDRRR